MAVATIVAGSPVDAGSRMVLLVCRVVMFFFLGMVGGGVRG
jgi:hypothetical protein